MTYQEAATHLLASATYRMSMPERSACEAIQAGNNDDESCRILRGLMTEFARELAAARPIEPVAPIETADQEGAALL
jgi:hypothetical protein